MASEISFQPRIPELNLRISNQGQSCQFLWKECFFFFSFFPSCIPSYIVWLFDLAMVVHSLKQLSMICYIYRDTVSQSHLHHQTMKDSTNYHQFTYELLAKEIHFQNVLIKSTVITPVTGIPVFPFGNI